MLSRGVWPYERSPWVWARIADRRLPLADRRALVSQFVKLPFCCSDSGFTARLQSVIKSEEDLLPDGQFHSVLEIQTMHRVINVKIENNFARAASQSKATRGLATRMGYMAPLRRLLITFERPLLFFMTLFVCLLMSCLRRFWRWAW